MFHFIHCYIAIYRRENSILFRSTSWTILSYVSSNIFLCIFPFFIGGVLRFCQLINNKKNQHVWKFQLEKFIGIALPSALIGFSPILLFSPIGQFFPYLAYLAILTLLNTTFPVIINIIAGYSLLDSFIRKEN